MKAFTKYDKFLVAALGAAITWAVSAYANNPGVSHWLGLVVAVLTAAGVYVQPNKTD